MALATSASVAVPAYFYPAGTNLAYWDRLRGSASSVAMTVATGLELEGSQPDANYQTQLTRLHDAGVRVLAYVTTSGGSKSPARVEAEIDRAYGWNRVDGIFFDEAVAYPVTCSQVGYYGSLDRYVKTKGGSAVTVVNHGQILPECYASVADVLLTAETDYGAYKDSWRQWGWEASYPASKFWHLVHGVDSIDKMHEVVALSRARNAGYVFATSATASSPGGPYGSLPNRSYWDAELSTVASLPTGTGPASTTTTTRPPTTTTRPPASRTSTTTTTRAPSTNVAPQSMSVGAFSPASGLAGSTVTISGRGFSGTTSVNLASAPVKVLSVTDTAVRVQLNSWNQTGRFTVNRPGGSSATSAGVFTVTTAVPVITSMSPGSGAPGSAVRMLGNGFTGASSVTLDGAPVTVTGVTDTVLDVRLNSWSRSGSFTVTLPGGASATSTTFTVT